MPRIMPACVIAGVVIVGDFARRSADERLRLAPSPSPGRSPAPSRCRPARTLMLAGFRSRWMIPCSCAASSASAICFAIGSASSSGIGAARDALRQIVALDQFHHQRAHAAGFFEPVDRRRCSDDSATRASCASRVNRARRSGSFANASGRTLDARRRDRASCRVAR